MQETGPVNAVRHGAWRRLMWLSAAALCGTLLVSLFEQGVGWGPRIIVIVFVVLTVLRPFDGLLALAALGPLAVMMFVATRSASVSLRFEEAVVLACLTGWSLKRAVEPRPLRVSPWVAWSAGLLIASAVASALVSGVRMTVERPEDSVAKVFETLVTRGYLVLLHEVSASMLIVEGLLLLLLVSELCGSDRERRYRVVRMMVIGAAAAAALNVFRLVTAALAREEPLRVLLSYLQGVRVNVHYADLNAAGSYFAMMLFFAVGIAVRSPLVAGPSAVLIVAGLWVSGSRTALAATLGTAALAAILLLRGSRRRLATMAVLACAALAAFGVWKWYPEGRNAASRIALDYRIEMAKTGFKLVRDEPVFGVGFGRFYSQSARYSSEQENAHNNFIQIAAESGVTGLLLFLAVVVFSVRGSWRDPDPMVRGLVVGIAAFLITCLAGHPLLTAAAAYPFWMALGLVSAPTGPLETVPRGIRLLALGLMLMIAAALPFRITAAERNADVEHASSGFSKWQRAEDGSRYRWAGARATFFIASSARAVRIPLRRGPDAPASVEVRLFLDGQEADRALLHEGEDWRVVRLVSARKAEARFVRIDLEAVVPRTLSPLQNSVTETSGVLMVGRPVIEE